MLSQDGAELDKEVPIMHAFVSLVAAGPGSLDCWDVAESSIISGLCTLTSWVSKSASSSASALSDVDRWHLELFSSQSINVNFESNLIKMKVFVSVSEFKNCHSTLQFWPASTACFNQ